MSILTYFAYGSNMLTERLQRRVPSANPLGAAICDGYELAFHKRGRDGSAKCSIVESVDSRVHGVVFELHADERHLLDRAEGLGAGYSLVELRVMLESGPTSAFSYAAQQAYIDDELVAFDWYHELVLAGAAEHGLPGSYLEQLHAFEAVPDDDSERATANRAIIRAADSDSRG